MTTPHDGASSQANCSVCDLDTCHSHGACHVTADYTYTCHCQLGYGLSNDCQYPIEALVITSVCLAMLFLGAGLSAVQKRIRRLRAHGLYTYSQLIEREEEVSLIHAYNTLSLICTV